ncbi:threonine ammonia-lyase [Streptomyces clavuligerus]|uniref:Dehydratase n=1 Tax=Streptomyces clavuligerus TaxID=1901 RepID=D5SKW2_STRCL|nr:threonine/serine dehydratase [Streptomyces clavuligerus]AXU17351.1 threonine/serine dehydratase [Streptomyces clavuligerus]EFG04555.1 dehydratase [Streptomyces clavuligerus]MBY6306996.1 threonine/serine dehydratase [Streptomyces clavuligerus]QCS10420.1 threonine/serine dehydratase [Streptomyces clavuligerus]QPJ97538.1 pyridoxal-phosphate dependent enzyme [Streptomyces clavuligerus]
MTEPKDLTATADTAGTADPNDPTGPAGAAVTRKPDLVTLDEVRAAARRVTEVARRTPLLRCDGLHGGHRVFVKAENLQSTGSFKVRGAANALLSLDPRPRSVVTFSAGNHGAAVALVGRALGVTVTVCMPPGAVAAKVGAVRRYGGEIVFTDDLIGSAAALAAERGCPVLHPFDDPAVIAGQGTTALEIFEEVPHPDVILVPVGGGGLISGVAAVTAALSDGTRVIGVEPETAPTVGHALRRGTPEPLPVPPRSAADGLNAPRTGALPLAHVRQHAVELVTVGEEDIRRAWPLMAAETRLLVEPSAAVTVAALRSGRIGLPECATVVLIATGGNTSLGALGDAASSANAVP